MPSTMTALAGLAHQGIRSATYYGLGEIARRMALRQAPARPRYRPHLPVPTRQQLFASVWELMKSDAQMVREGLCPAFNPDDGLPGSWLARARAMISDLPDSLRRAAQGDAHEVRELPESTALPEYYRQNFHFQSGGYLTPDSARLYDLQVETLFMGTASLMRRQLMRPLAEFIAGKDQRRLQMADVACGTGRLLAQVLETYPRLNVTGIDLSVAYLDEARNHLADLGRTCSRPGRGLWLETGNVESLPLADASQDIVASVFLFHELPAPVRRVAARELARVLKPGGMLLFLDSAQYGDIPGWDGVLESFPHRFHEPYYAHYVEDDLDGLFTAAGLIPQETRAVLLSKLMVRRRAE